MLDFGPRFELDKDVIDGFKRKKVEWGPVGEVTYLRTYARPTPTGKEKWWQTVQRVVEGTYTIQRWHCKRQHLPWDEDKAQESAAEMYELIFKMKFLPPGRGLWAMGSDAVAKKGGAVLNNCAFISTANISTSFVEPFQFMMDMSMLGCGVGFDTKGKVKLKRYAKAKDVVWDVEDTREGWCEALGLRLSEWLGSAATYDFDYYKVRPVGAQIVGFGGTASGPEPLMRLLDEDVPTIMGRYDGKWFEAEGIVDLMNAIGRCVVSGNVRRTAQVALGYLNDKKFLRLKDREINKERMEKWGWASNNSVYADVGMFYGDVSMLTATNGEPGYLWLDNCRQYGRMVDARNDADMRVAGSNPCLEQSLEDGELCCLVETFPAKHELFDEFKRTLKFAYLYAKTVTLVPTHNEKTNKVMLRNRRIGTSQSGIVRAINRHGWATHREWCDEGYKYLKELDKVYSEWLCVPRSVKITSVKPSGTVSLLPGEPPGVHYPYSKYYFRTIRFARGSDLVRELREKGYKVEEDVVDGNSEVVYFPIEEKDYEKGRDEVSMWEQLAIAANMQAWWADNQVSVTITFKREEMADIERALEIYETQLKSVSFLPLVEHGYEQAPYIKISSVEEYNMAVRKINEGKLKGGDESEQGGFGCDGDFCKI